MKRPTNMQDRRNWKGQTVDYAAIQAYDLRECQYCLTDAQIAVLGGVIEFLAWDTRWIGIPDGDESRKWILEFKNDIQRRLMMPCGCENLIYRYTGDGVLESSDDDGTTWTPAPQDDPRINSPQFPPVPGDDGDDKKCVAAAGMVALIKEQIGEQLTDGMSRYTLSQLITDWVRTMIDSSNPFQALLTVVTNQIFALVIATLRPALTDPVYDTLKCIFYCHLEGDATVTGSNVDEIRSDITSMIGGIAGVFLEHLVFLLGERGLSNLARAAGAATGDCSDCECEGDALVYSWDELAGVSTRLFPDGDGVYTAHSGTSTSGGRYTCSIYFHEELPVPAHWQGRTITVISNGAAGAGEFYTQYRCSDYVGDVLATCLAQATFANSLHTFDVVFTVGEICCEV